MQKVHYIKIQNFKVFGEETQIDFDNPTVLIGANNSGKTTVIQALSLWSWAVKMLFDRKKVQKLEENKVILNRLDIPQMSIKESRFFWNRTNIEKQHFFKLKVGLLFHDQIQELSLIFSYHSSETFYAEIENFDINPDLLEFAAYLKINLLYPMVGMRAEEDFLQENTIQRYIGRGQTASVLRNICYHLYEKSPSEWEFLSQLMTQLFFIRLKEPMLRSTGTVEVVYNYLTIKQKTEIDLDISLAGYGQQQMLLVLAYILANKSSVLMIDEPDAHLEILRQTQIFTILKEVAQKHDCQIIIVTHSEVVLNEADTVVFLADGKTQKISEKTDHKFIKNALKDYGIEHYYKARINPHILYIESSTDISMLKAFAKKFDHFSWHIFEDRLNFYYTQNEIAENTLENKLHRNSGSYSEKRHFLKHFHAIRSVVPHLKAIAIFDNDNQNRQDEMTNDLALLYWKKYELENYFINPKTILAFAEIEWGKRKVGNLFLPKKMEKLKQIIDNELVKPIFNNEVLFNLYQKSSAEEQQELFLNAAEKHKLSLLLEDVFSKLAQEEKESVLLNKGNYYQLIDFLDVMPNEVKEKLDMIAKYLSSEVHDDPN